jgi:ribonucleoside-diphosphate reductase alpha chain
MRTITHAAYEASADLASERGPFPLFDAGKYVAGAFVSSLPKRVRERISAHGIRNSHLTSIAPTGTISLLAGNVSSGIEPVFAWHYTRRIRQGDGDETRDHEVMDYAYGAYCDAFGRPGSDEDLPAAFVTTDDVTPAEHIAMQAALQKHVDSSISKTINVPSDFPFDEFKGIYRLAYEAGLKGCTTFRPSAHLAGVLVREQDRASSGGEIDEAPAGRPPLLTGTTYKVKTPLSPDAFYITINDVQDGDQARPYEIFINTKNLQHFSWIVAMTRLISAVFRKERDPSFLVEELTSIHDPAGGYFKNGEYVPSLPAELGRVLEMHLSGLGLGAKAAPASGGPAAADGGGIRGGSPGGICPMCRQPGLISQENCLKCRFCDYSKCG